MRIIGSVKQQLGISCSARGLISLMLVIIALGLSSCYEDDMTISVGEQSPPTFKLSGSGNLMFFAVWEVHAENQRRSPFDRDGNKNTLLWQVSPDDLNSHAKVISRLPPITYGSVPTGFMQKVPESGSPPILIEGKIYEAGGPASNANGGFVWFTVRSGRVVKVDAPGGY